jgi:hypothetical protein
VGPGRRLERLRCARHRRRGAHPGRRAPAGHRVGDTGDHHEGPLGLAYTTVTETRIGLVRDVLTIEGRPASVLRRYLAAAQATKLGVEPDPELVGAALAEERERGANIAEARVRTQIAEARPWAPYAADVESP